METNPSLSKPLSTSAELETFYQDMQIRTLNLVVLFLAGTSALLYGLGFQNLDQAWYRVISLGLLIETPLSVQELDDLYGLFCKKYQEPYDDPIIPKPGLFPISL